MTLLAKPIPQVYHTLQALTTTLHWPPHPCPVSGPPHAGVLPQKPLSIYGANQFSCKEINKKGNQHPLFPFKSMDEPHLSSRPEPIMSPDGTLTTLGPSALQLSSRAPAPCSPGLYCPGKQVLQPHLLLVPLILYMDEKLCISEQNPLVEGLGE